MKYVILTIGLLLSGCTTTAPVKIEFPKVPDTLRNKCAELEKVKEEASISDISKVIVTNYTKYHECSLKNDSWLEWYETQKKIFEGIK